ncbi:uncharacterized protein LOC144581401 [Callithrix jacchus]
MAFKVFNGQEEKVEATHQPIYSKRTRGFPPSGASPTGRQCSPPRTQTRIPATQESWTKSPTTRTHYLAQANCQTGGCQSTVSILIPYGKSIILSSDHGFHFQHGLCFLCDQTKDYCHWWNTIYGEYPYSSCVIHKPQPPSCPNRMLTLFGNGSLALNIHDPWHSCWDAGVSSKVYEVYTWSHPQGTWLIFWSYTHIVSETIEQLCSVSHTILQNEAILTN